MSQIEFETMIDKGAITVPSEYRSRIHGRVRVIIITDEADDDIDMIEYLMQHPLNANNVRTYADETVYRIWKPCPLSRQNRGLRLCKAVFNFQLRKS